MPPSSATAYQALQAFKPQSAQDVIGSANNQAGVGAAQTRVSDLRGSVANLNSAINAVDPSVTGRTSGTFTTEGQRSALVAKEQQPLQTDLTARNQDLNLASADLGTAQGNANTLAAAILSQDKDTYQHLLDQYNASVATEKQAEDARQYNATLALEQQKLAETAREANLKTDTGIDLSKFLPTSSAVPTMTQRMGGGGYNFTDASGKAISAAKYAQLTGNDVAGVLRSMAQSGDTYAANAYADLSKAKTPQARANVIRNFNALFWGT